MLGVLIVFYNDINHIERLSKALKNQSFRDFHVYVLDNNPSLNHVKEFRSHYSDFIDIVASSNLGFAAGNNVLAKKAIEDGMKYLMVLNPDMEPEPNALKHMINFLKKNPDYGAVGPLLMYGTGKKHSKIQLFGGEVDFNSQKKTFYLQGESLSKINLQKVKDVTMINGGSLMIRSDWVKKNNLFDERYFMYNDEIDLMRRLLKNGDKIAVLSGAIIWHYHDWSRKNKKGYAIMYYYIMRNKMLYLHKFKMYNRLFMEVVTQLIKSPASIIFCLKISGIELIRYYFLGLWHGLLNKKGKSSINFR